MVVKSKQGLGKLKTNTGLPSTTPGVNPLNVDTDEIFGMRASFSNMDGDNAVKYFMEAAKDFRTNLLRANLPNVRIQIAVVQFYDYCVEFKLTRRMQWLIDWLVATRAIGGRAVIEGMQTAINIMAEQLMISMTGTKMGREQLKEMKENNDRQRALNAQAQGGPTKV